MQRFSRFPLYLCVLVSAAADVDAEYRGPSHNAVQIQWIRHYAAVTAPGRDEPQKIETDDLGNTYVAGTSERLGNPQQGMLLKYDPEGNELWRVEFPLGKLMAMSVDFQSNVYLLHGGQYTPLQLSKFASDGTRKWSIANQPITAFALDNNSNCLVLTQTRESLGWYGPYLTRTGITKYSPEGTHVWSDTVFQDTTAESGGDLIVGAGGNIVVTFGPHLIKLDSNAVPLWSLHDMLKRCYQLLVDGANNIYALTAPPNWNAGVQDSVYSLVKILPDGHREWEYDFLEKIRQDEPMFKLQCDGHSNIYVVADIGSTLAIDKIEPSGRLQWNTKIQQNDMRMWDCATTPGGRICVGVATWYSCDVISVDSSGQVLWTKDLNEGKDIYHLSTLSGGLVADAHGNITLSCLQRQNPNVNWHTVRVDKNGETLWESIYDYRGNTQDYVYDLALDHSSGIYVTGRSESFDTIAHADPDAAHFGHHWDFATVKYSPEGNLNWVARDNGDAHEGDYYRNLFLNVDPTGHAVVSGANLVTLNEYGAAIIQYDGAGKKVWDSHYAVQHEFLVEGMVGDSEGNVYITGTESYWHVKYIDPDVTWTTTKYSPTGEILWRVHIRDSSITSNILYQAEDIALDSLGNVIAVAMEWSRSGGSGGITLHKYTADGRLIWKTRLDDPGCELQDLEISRYSGIYLSSLVRHPLGLQFETMMFDSAGVLQWRSTFEGTCAIPRPMTIDSEGGAYVTGCGLAKYDRDGNLRWYLGQEEGDAITCDGESAVYVVRNNRVAKYSTSGTSVWSIPISNTAESKEFLGRKIKVDKDYNVIVTGTSTMGTAEISGIVYTTVKLTQNPTAADDRALDVPFEFRLYQNYPNPFNPTTTIKFELPRASHVVLKVFNTLGQEVATLVDEMQEPGYKSVEFNAGNLASGIYFYRLQAGDFVQSKKLLLLK